MSLIDLWIATDYSNADEKESMIGDVRLTNEVLGTVKDTVFFVCCAVWPTGECGEIYFQFSTRCVCVQSQVSAKYALELFFHPLFTWRQFWDVPKLAGELVCVL